MSASDTLALNLVNSRRLQSLRERGANANAALETDTTPDTTGSDAMQQFIAWQIESVLAAMPVGKRNSLFKIRYGMTPDEVRSQAPLQAAKILGIRIPSKMTSRHGKSPQADVARKTGSNPWT